MKEIDKLKLKKRFLTGIIGLSTFCVNGLASTIDVEAIDTNQALESTQNIDNSKPILSTQDMVKKYSSIFNLDYDSVNEILSDYTRGYTSYEWDHNNVMNGKAYDNQEEAIVSTIKDIYYNPKNHGIDNKDEIKSEEEYVFDSEPEYMIREYANIYNINEVPTLSIVYTECGSEVNSNNYNNNNNPAGLGPHMHFENKEIGFIYFVELLKNSYNFTMDTDKAVFNKIAHTYCPGGEDGWISLATPFYNNLEQDYFYYAPELAHKHNFTKLIQEKQIEYLMLSDEMRKRMVKNLNK